ncbi:TFIIB-type zinc ribbon-containing protein [Lysobacter humi (ex Lee et al. 2017)]
MKCPVCTDIDLAMTDRQGIEIDYCPRCRGIWLDRGELDRLIERAERSEAAPAPRPTPQPPPTYPPREQPGYSSQHDHHGHAGQHGHYKKKHKSLLGELFDF